MNEGFDKHALIGFAPQLVEQFLYIKSVTHKIYKIWWWLKSGTTSYFILTINQLCPHLSLLQQCPSDPPVVQIKEQILWPLPKRHHLRQLRIIIRHQRRQRCTSNQTICIRRIGKRCQSHQRWITKSIHHHTQQPWNSRIIVKDQIEFEVSGIV